MNKILHFLLAASVAVPQAMLASETTAIIASPKGAFESVEDSSDGLLPFNLPAPAVMRASKKKVFAHYHIFPKNMSDTSSRPLANDFYSSGYLDINGENDKHKTQGGYLRDRPLSLPPDPTLTTEEFVTRCAESDVRDGINAGLDGFVINFTSASENDNWWKGTYRHVFEAAHKTSPGFGLMLMPDCTIGFKEPDPQKFVELVERFKEDPAVFRHEGKIVLAPYSGERFTPAQWKNTLAQLKSNKTPVFLVPCVQGFDRLAPVYATTAQGLAEWSAICDSLANCSSKSAQTASKLVHKAGYSIWMQPVRPQDFRPHTGSVNEAGNTRLLRESWMRAIESRAEWVQIITWSDHYESSAIRPAMGAQHLFADLSAYFSTWHKMGKPPAITRDALFYCYRQHSSKAAVDTTRQTKGVPIKYRGIEPVDEIEMISFLTEPATLGISIEGRSHTVNAKAGVTSFVVPLREGRPEFTITRAGKSIVRTRGRFTVSDKVIFSDCMYFGGSSLRERNYATKPAIELSDAVLELSFNEVWGPICYDSSGYAHHATAYETSNASEVTTLPHAYGNAANAVFFFPPNTPGRREKHLRIPLTPALSTKMLSVSAWIKPAEGASGSIVDARNADGSGFIFDIATPGSLTCKTASGSVSCPIAMDSNEWTHIVVTLDGTKARLYVNGASKSSADCGKLSWNGNGEVRIAHGYAGGLDELTIFDRALSDDEIAAVAAGNTILAHRKR